MLLAHHEERMRNRGPAGNGALLENSQAHLTFFLALLVKTFVEFLAGPLLIQSNQTLYLIVLV